MVALGPKNTLQNVKPHHVMRPNGTARISPTVNPAADIDAIKPPTLSERAANLVEGTAGVLQTVGGVAGVGLMLAVPLGAAAKYFKLQPVSKVMDYVHAPLQDSLGHTSAGKSMAGAFSNVTHRVASVAESLGLRKASHSIRNAPQNIAKNPTANTLLDGVFITASALSLFGVARTGLQQIEGLRHMVADLTGKDYNSITAKDVLFGDVPPLVAKERKIVLERTGFRAAVEGINMGVSLRSMVTGKFNMFTMMIIPMAFNMLGEALIPESVMGVYKGLKDAHAKGVEIPPDTLLAFIQLAQPELARHKVQFSQALVEEYAAEKTSPADMLREANDGKMMARLNAIVEKHANDKPAISHVDRLAGKASGQALPVLGAHTAKVAEAAASPAEVRL